MKIALIGLGAIGGSFAMGLKAAGYDDVYGVDLDSETIATAEKEVTFLNIVINCSSCFYTS